MRCVVLSLFQNRGHSHSGNQHGVSKNKRSLHKASGIQAGPACGSTIPWLTGVGRRLSGGGLQHLPRALSRKDSRHSCSCPAGVVTRPI